MKIYFYKKESIVIKWIRICSICVAAACIAFALHEDVKYPVWILPLIHAVGMFLLGDNNATVPAPGIITLNAVMFCRYQVVPLSIYLSQRVSKYAMNTRYIDQAIGLMALELIVILLVIGVTGSNYRKRTRDLQAKPISQLFIPQNKSFIFTVMLLVLIAIAIQFPSLVGGIGLLLTGKLSVTSREAGFSGIIDMVWRAGLAWVYVYSLSKIKDRDSTGRKSWILIIVLTLVYILFTFIMNLGISRWYSLVCFAASVFMLEKLFPQVHRRVVIWTIVPVFVVLVILSVYKNTSYLSMKNSGGLSIIVDLLDVSTLDVYFAGPGCVNNGLNLYHSGKGGLMSLPLDTLRNMPFISHFINDAYSTVELYANMLGRGDMIIPLSIQSIIFFGAPFFGVLGGIVIVLLRKMDELYMLAENALAYIYGFVAVWMGVVFVLNYTICVSWCYSFIIPMGVLFLLTTNRKREEEAVDSSMD